MCLGCDKGCEHLNEECFPGGSSMREDLIQQLEMKEGSIRLTRVPSTPREPAKWILARLDQTGAVAEAICMKWGDLRCAQTLINALCETLEDNV